MTTNTELKKQLRMEEMKSFESNLDNFSKAIDDLTRKGYLDKILEYRVKSFHDILIISEMVYVEALKSRTLLRSFSRMVKLLFETLKISTDNFVFDNPENMFTETKARSIFLEHFLDCADKNFENRLYVVSDYVDTDLALIEKERGRLYQKQQAITNILLFGELFLLDIISIKRMHDILDSLLKQPYDDDYVLCACDLLEMVGPKYDTPIVHWSMINFLSLLERFGTQNDITQCRVQFVVKLFDNGWKVNAAKISVPSTDSGIDLFDKEK
jgi:hypothetical protein